MSSARFMQGSTSGAACCSLLSGSSRHPQHYRLFVAYSFRERALGLISPQIKGRVCKQGSIMVFAPCRSIHSLGMRTALDVAFVARDGEVLKTWCGMPPWRVFNCKRAAFAVERIASEGPWFDVGDYLYLDNFREGMD